MEPPPAAPSASVATMQDARSEQPRSHELVFIDQRVPDYQVLVDDLIRQNDGSREVEIFLLDPNRDGVAQIDKILAGEHNLAAIHIISHGSDGAIDIGSTHLDAERLANDADAVVRWGQALAAGGDLLLYGCDVAQDATGQAFVGNLARLTGADVAASTDITGSAARGGDWMLEYQTGTVQARVVASAFDQIQWQGALATYTVTNTSNSGAGSLRQAITDANTNAGTDSIVFNIAGTGIHAISLTSALPSITGAVVLDATTDDSFAANGSKPAIELNGTSAGAGVAGLTLNSGGSGSTIRGLAINRFTSHGILLDGADNVTIAGNYIGTGTTGLVDLGNGANGIQLDNGAQNNTIGGLTTADRNVISGNSNAGVAIDNVSSTGNVVIGNYIGLGADGSTSLGNNDDGVHFNTAGANTVGSTLSAGRNVISANGINGVGVADTSGVTIIGNYIGTDATGLVSKGNASAGVQFSSSIAVTSGTVGGTSTGAGNLISFNAGDGVYVKDSTVSGISIQGNSIASNTGLGIDLGTNGVTANDAGDGDTGANKLQNYPVLTSANSDATGTTIAGTLNSTANTSFRIEFHSNRPSVADATNGEGERYLGFATVTTNGSGNATINTTLGNVWVNAGDKITATATLDLGGGNYGSTSEFAANVTSTSTGIIVVDTTSDVSDGTTTSITNLGNARGADGRISLREAIIAANNTANGAGGADRISFNIAGPTGFVGTSGVDGRYVISLASALPSLDQSVIIDATTQTSTAGNSNVGFLGTGGTVGVDGLTLSQVARPEIELVGGSSIATGFDINASSVTIRGFAMRAFASESVLLRDAYSGSLIEQNILGSGATAFADPGAGNRTNAQVRSLGADGVTVQNNLIGFADATGVYLNTNSDGWTVQNNEVVDIGIGFDNGDGIAIGTSTGTLVQGNRIAGSSTQALLVASGAASMTISNNTITGNNVGRVGAAPIQNDAIAVRSGVSGLSINRNVITANYGTGVRINNGASGISVLQNSIYANGTITSRNGSAASNQIGIDLQSATDDTSFGTAAYYTLNDAGDGDGGGNNLQNFPVLTAARTDGASQLILTGTLNSTANTQFRIEFFANTAQDGTGYGEGQRYLGFANVTTDGAGNATISTTLTASVAVGEFVSATATKSNASYSTFTDTSEFAQNVTATAATNSAPVEHRAWGADDR